MNGSQALAGVLPAPLHRLRLKWRDKRKAWRSLRKLLRALLRAGATWCAASLISAGKRLPTESKSDCLRFATIVRHRTAIVVRGGLSLAPAGLLARMGFRLDCAFTYFHEKRFMLFANPLSHSGTRAFHFSDFNQLINRHSQLYYYYTLSHKHKELKNHLNV